MNQQSDISKQWDIFNNNKERNIGAYKNNGKCPSNYVESSKKKREIHIVLFVKSQGNVK